MGATLSGEHVERRLAAILAADVAGSCRLIGIDEEGTLARLKALRRTLFDPKIAEHHGRVVKNTGDGAIAEFASVVDAVRCADEIQRGMAEQNIDVPQDKRIELRIGIHVGDIIIEENETLWNVAPGPPASIRFDAHELHHLAPFLDFIGDELSEVGGGTRKYRGAQIGVSRLYTRTC